MNTQSLPVDRPHFVRLGENNPAATNTASRLRNISNCCETVKTLCCPILKTLGLLTAGFAVGGVMGSAIARGLMEHDVNSSRFNDTAEVKKWAKTGAGVGGFVVGGMIGMTTVAVHRGVSMINNALQEYQSVAREEPTQPDTGDLYNNPIYLGGEPVTDLDSVSESA